MRSYGTRIRGPAGALLWEDWRRSRVAFLIVLLLGIGVSLTAMAVTTILWLQGSSHARDIDPDVYVLAVWPLVFYGLFLVFSLADPSDVSPRIPARHYTLPMPPHKVALVHLLFRLVSIGALTAVLAGLTQLAFLSFAPLQLIEFAGIAMAIFLVVQTLAWTVGNVGSIPFLVSAFGLPVVLSLIVDAGWMGASLDSLEGIGVPKELVVLGVLAGFAYLAIQGACWGRQPRTLRDVRWVLPAFTRTSRRELSPLAAQTAYEWRRKGRALPLATLALVAGSFLVLPFFPLEGTSYLAMAGSLLVLAPIYLSPLAAAVAGVLAMLDDYRQAQSGVATFLFTRALSTDLHSRARLRMSVLATLANLALCVALMLTGLAIMAVFGPPSALDEITPSVSPASVDVVLALAAHTLIVWSLFWLGGPAIVVWILMMMLYGAVETLGGRSNAPVAEVALALAVCLTGLLLVGAVFALWRSSVSHGFMTRRTKATCGITFAIATVCAFRFVGIDFFAGGIESALAQLTGLFLTTALCAVPLLPILAQPLVVNRLRRR